MSATEILPAVSELLPVPGRYDLRNDRCVVALTRRLLGVPVLHGRLRPTASTLHVDASSDDGDHRLTFTLMSVRWLQARRHPVVRFTAERVIFGPERRLRLPGTAVVRGEELPLTLSGTLHYCDSERVVLWVRGVVGRVHVEAAAEFVR